MVYIDNNLRVHSVSVYVTMQHMALPTKPLLMTLTIQFTHVRLGVTRRRQKQTFSCTDYIDKLPWDPNDLENDISK